MQPYTSDDNYFNANDAVQEPLADEVYETQDETESAEPVPERCALTVCFIDFLGDPIPDLPYQIIADQRRSSGVTSALGESEKILDLTPGSAIDIHVQKEHSGEYKLIGSLAATAGEMLVTALSAKIRLECETELHQGEPGPAEPPVVPSAEIAKPPAQASTSSAASTQSPPKQAAPAAAKAPSAAPKRVVTTTRNAQGNPVVRYVETTRDWLGRRLAAAWNLWTWQDFPSKQPSKVIALASATKPRPTSAPTKANTTHGHAKVNPPVPAAGRYLDASGLERLQVLCTFAEKQVMVDYSGSTSAAIALKYKRDAEPTLPAKTNVTKGQCLKYVKVALLQAGYVNGIAGTEFAKDSGRDWIKYGFKDVTGTLPSVTVLMKNGQETAQPDIMFTLPGDVIVYEKNGAPGEPGHIDIRTYHGFISDFSWPRPIPDVKKYVVTGVFRKLSDSLALVRAKSFLRILRDHEAKGFKDPYRALRFDPSKKGNMHLTFEDTNRHPYEGGDDKPAGAYQIKSDTLVDVEKITGWRLSFNAESQDRIAMFLLQRRPLSPVKPGGPPRRTALGYIFEGKIEEAVGETRLWNEWACLPGGGKQAQLTMSELTSVFAKYVQETR